MVKLKMKNELINDKSIEGTLFRGYYKTFMIYSLPKSTVNNFNLSILSDIEDIENVVIRFRGGRILNKIEVSAIRRMMVTLNG